MLSKTGLFKLIICLEIPFMKTISNTEYILNYTTFDGFGSVCVYSHPDPEHGMHHHTIRKYEFIKSNYISRNFVMALALGDIAQAA